MKHGAFRLAAALTLILAFATTAFAATAKPAPDANASVDELDKNLKDLRAAQMNADDELNPAKLDAAAADVLKDLPPDEYMVGLVESKEHETIKDVGGVATSFRTYKVKITDGKEKGKEVMIDDNDLDTVVKGGAIAPGERIAVVKTTGVDGVATYHVADRYRVSALWWIVAAFLAAAVVFGGWRGFTSVFGLGATVLIIMQWAMPKVLGGAQAFPTILAAVFAAALLSLYLAHGFNRRTTLAVAGTVVTLVISVGVEELFVRAAQLHGLGSEEAFFLQGSGFAGIDLRGLLLGGILIGVLGILDDVTTAQVAVVEELKAANRAFGFRDLYRRGISVGKEHIASLTNTLFLAYAGASLPLFLLFTSNKAQPIWYIANSEVIAEEVVRTLVGSICLILAVPISTAIAARWYATRAPARTDEPAHLHHHHH
jgi:uncharacterized membrane protein